MGALVLVYYAYLALKGISVTGSLISGFLLQISLAMMFGLNVAVVSRWPSKETHVTAANPENSVVAGTTTKDILFVQRQLGHRILSNTVRYTNLVNFDSDDEFMVKAAKSKVEPLIEAGYKFVVTRTPCRRQPLTSVT